tara:strand:- start:850 stop:1296 length:447 start_codon:yes stop_codon:yes gene_type:complete
MVVTLELEDLVGYDGVPNVDVVIESSAENQTLIGEPLQGIYTVLVVSVYTLALHGIHVPNAHIRVHGGRSNPLHLRDGQQIQDRLRVFHINFLFVVFFSGGVEADLFHLLYIESVDLRVATSGEEPFEVTSAPFDAHLDLGGADGLSE